jgi:predicted TIM-barrel fold metal-dependent hydrolase
MLRLQDNLVFHLVRMAREFDLPVQIHTGYSTPTMLGNPEGLYSLARHREFTGVQFYLCHAGWPNHGGLALMARTYANIHFGFCWMPGLSPALACRLMDEMFDMIPANKMLVGMDCGSLESFYGTALVTRELVARVLAAKVDSGLISRRAAAALAWRFLCDNGFALFGRPEERAAHRSFQNPRGS